MDEVQPHLPLRLRGRAVWTTPEERDSWRASVAAAATAASLAYCAAALGFHAQRPLQALADRAKGAARKQKQLPPAPQQQQQQQQAGSSKAGARRGA